jgi:hypothetical protein
MTNCSLLSRRDKVLVAWQELPGWRQKKPPSRSAGTVESWRIPISPVLGTPQRSRRDRDPSFTLSWQFLPGHSRFVAPRQIPQVQAAAIRVSPQPLLSSVTPPVSAILFPVSRLLCSLSDVSDLDCNPGSAPFREFAVKTFAAGETSNKGAPKKRLAAARAFPISQVGRRKVVSNKCQCKDQAWKEKKKTQLQHERQEQGDDEKAKTPVPDPSIPEARLHKRIIRRFRRFRSFF